MAAASSTPTNLNFGSVPLVPTPPPTATATLTIPAGLELVAFGLGGTNIGDFTVDVTSTTGCLGVPGPVTCTANFTFSPTATGARSAVGSFAIDQAGGGPAQDLFCLLYTSDAADEL